MIEKLKKYFTDHPIIRMSVAAIVMIGLMILSMMAIERKKTSGIKEFHVNIEYADSKKVLINEAYVNSFLQKKLGFNVSHARIEDIPIMQIENLLNKNPYIAKAEVYVDANNRLEAKILQKNPIVRINGEKSAFYLDEFGNYIPWSKIATVRVPIATGEIEEYKRDFLEKKDHQLKDILLLAREISKDEFLLALVEQIHFQNSREILLIPKLGKEKIILGDIYGLDEKLFKLKEFYKEGLTREGWGKYAYLDLKYEDLVYARKD